MFGRQIFSARSITTSFFRNKEIDLVTDAYLKQIRDLAAKQKAAGGDLWESSPEFKKELQEQLSRLAKKFQLSSTEAVTKLDLKFKEPTIESSVAAFADGKSIDQLLDELKSSKTSYDQEQAEKKRKEEEFRAMFGGQGEEEFMPLPMPLKELPAKKA